MLIVAWGNPDPRLLMIALLYPRVNNIKKPIPFAGAAQACIAHIWQFPSAVKHNIVFNYQIGDTYHYLVKLVQQSYHQTLLDEEFL